MIRDGLMLLGALPHDLGFWGPLAALVAYGLYAAVAELLERGGAHRDRHTFTDKGD